MASYAVDRPENLLFAWREHLNPEQRTPILIVHDRE